MTNFIEAVIEFNQQVLGIHPRPLGPLSAAEEQLTVKCLIEEAEEFSAAAIKGDFIGQVDAIADLMYFATGAFYKLGLSAEQIEACLMAVHAANITKKKGVNAKRSVPGASDAVKSEGWVPPEERLKSILFKGVYVE